MRRTGRRYGFGLLAIGVLALLLGVGVYGRFYRTLAAPTDPAGPVDDGKALPPADEFEHLAKTDPVAMYEKCLAKYAREVKHGFTATLVKRERVKGEPADKDPGEEKISLAVRGDVPDPATGKPPGIEVVMKWLSGARRPLLAEIRGSLYSEKPPPEGTGGRVQVLQSGFISLPPQIAPSDPLAQGQSRYSIRDAGVYRGMFRTYEAWKQRKEAGTLKTEYLGKKEIPELDGRVCYVVARTCVPPEADPFDLGGRPVVDPEVIKREGFTRVEIMIDADTWMQLGTKLYRPDGKLLAEYYFRNPNTDPKFEADTFTVAGLKKK